MKPRVAIVDYGMGNLFSVKHACEHVGLAAVIVDIGADLLASDALILPGVGAFGDAMDALRERNLIDPLREYAATGKLLVGVCLGMQLLMSESHEFGLTAGLDLVSGAVLPLEPSSEAVGEFKVPHVGWNRIIHATSARDVDWARTMLAGLPGGVHMYFVHSYHVMLDDPSVTIAVCRYGASEFCAAFERDNVFGCQFHPERSGRNGLKIYENLASRLGCTVGQNDQ